MDNNLNVRKLYIDTRYKLDTYGSNSKFTIEFPQTIECPENTVMYVDEVVLPNTITTIQEGVNDDLYFVIYYGEQMYYHKTTLTERNYTLPAFADEVKTQLTLWMATDVGNFTTTVDVNRITMTLRLTDTRRSQPDVLRWGILTDEELKAGLFQNTKIPEPHTCNDILQNYFGKLSPLNLHERNYDILYHVDLHTTRNLYLLADLGEFRTVTNFPWSGSSVLKKIQMNVPYNETLFFNVVMPYDCTHVGNMSFNRLNFHLVNSKGNYPNLRHNWSFSLIFDRQ